MPGNVISDDFEICCGEGSIKVLTIQREGKRVQQIREFLLGSQIKKGINIAYVFSMNAEILKIIDTISNFALNICKLD